MVIFDLAVAFTLDEEGGLINAAGDPGGLTNFGISQRSYPNLNIAALTKENAIQIYATDFWAKIRGDQLPPEVGFYLFDTAVNLGVGGASRLFQRVLNITEDGIIGPQTIEAAIASNVKDLHNARVHYYTCLGGFAKFGQIWRGRANRCLAAALVIRGVN